MTIKINFEILGATKEPWQVERTIFNGFEYFQAFAVLEGGQKIQGRLRVRHDQAVLDAMDLNFSWQMGRAFEIYNRGKKCP